MIDVVIATGNPHKFRELTQLLRVSGIRWHSLAEFQVPSVRENRPTFDANAVKKARAVAQATGFYALADDSGIEVTALNGAPGVRSARFAGSHGDDAANNQKLLRLMRSVPKHRRGARYRCALALASPSKMVAITRGIWHGQVAFSPEGGGGFGYDPIIVVPKLGKTVAQLPKTVKRKLSHRAIAARRMVAVLKRLARH